VPTFGEIWRKMIDDVDKLTLSPATIADYEDRAGRLILPQIGKKRVGDVTAADVDRIVARTTGARNRAYVATLIKKTVNFAKRARFLPADHRNPAADVAVKRSSKKGRAIDAEDVGKFGAALAAMESKGAVSPWLANLFRPSLICGLRPREVSPLVAVGRRQLAEAQDDCSREDGRARNLPDRCGGGRAPSDAEGSGLRIRVRRTGGMANRSSRSIRRLGPSRAARESSAFAHTIFATLRLRARSPAAPTYAPSRRFSATRTSRRRRVICTRATGAERTSPSAPPDSAARC
jgi:hypothetical protein